MSWQSSAEVGGSARRDSRTDSTCQDRCAAFTSSTPVLLPMGGWCGSSHRKQRDYGRVFRERSSSCTLEPSQEDNNSRWGEVWVVDKSLLMGGTLPLPLARRRFSPSVFSTHVAPLGWRPQGVLLLFSTVNMYSTATRNPCLELGKNRRKCVDSPNRSYRTPVPQQGIHHTRYCSLWN
jgi:hypothetical protein